VEGKKYESGEGVGILEIRFAKRLAIVALTCDCISSPVPIPLVSFHNST
jgi:hypothetical protein